MKIPIEIIVSDQFPADVAAFLMPAPVVEEIKDADGKVIKTRLRWFLEQCDVIKK